ncbi:hypothetical protein HELRODRAFT_161031 [Helobdella robusta]|uniref:Uncharacterized protein n=1 Tax=Helobdella robusta TaxID=6412 RepID=T1ER11_HELRO|nr:hypothetical protein HELRODRAFT_161031 [Helobdella robusta]ESO01852.1 hypothetical protein HELRODRAFT_161031 [Helobdella robusta]
MDLLDGCILTAAIKKYMEKWSACMKTSITAERHGCATKAGPNVEGNNLTCRGEKTFTGDRNIYIAVSNCRSREGLLLSYRLDVYGYKEGTLCSRARFLISGDGFAPWLVILSALCLLCLV